MTWRGGNRAARAALGDGYLKRPLLSAAPYKANLPYITAKPKVRRGAAAARVEGTRVAWRRIRAVAQPTF